MDASTSCLLFLAYPRVYTLYTFITVSAVSLFMIFYIGNIVAQIKRGESTGSTSLPIWFNIMYPRWLDKLTFQGIVQACVQALGLAIGVWLMFAIAAVIIVAKEYSP